MAYQELVEKLRNAHAVDVTPFRDYRSIDYEGLENIQCAINDLPTFATIAQSVESPTAFAIPPLAKNSEAALGRTTGPTDIDPP